MNKKALLTLAILAGVVVTVVMLFRLTHINIGALSNRNVVEHHEQKTPHGAVEYNLVWDKSRKCSWHELSSIRKDEKGVQMGKRIVTLSGSPGDDATGFRSQSSRIVGYSLYDPKGLYEKFDGERGSLTVRNNKGQFVTYTNSREIDIGQRVDAVWRNELSGDVMRVILPHNEECKCESPCWKRAQK